MITKIIKNLVLVTLPAFLLFFLANFAMAQESPEEIAAKHGITFPIGQLGNCANYQGCMTYCEDPVNYEKCIAFAKEKGFYEEDPVATQKDAILAAAQNELGCNSFESCQSFCEDEANFDKCNSFAQKHSLSGGYTENPHEKESIEKAKNVLGCDTLASCMTFCEDQANWQKCSDFAKQVGFRGGHEVKGPGGCTTAETCQAFCSDPNNYQTCSNYTSQSGTNFSGPGGCSSEESCRTYCQDHPSECGYHSSEDSTTNYQDYESFCRQYPEKCSSQPTPGSSYEDYCKQYPDKCTFSSPPAYTNPEDYCKQYPDRCNQTQTQTQSSPAPTYESQQNTTSQPSYEQHSYDPATECQKSGGSWTGSTCQFQQVQGISTKGNFLMQLLHGILDFF